jgi:hypothetical protein
MRTAAKKRPPSRARAVLQDGKVVRIVSRSIVSRSIVSRSNLMRALASVALAGDSSIHDDASLRNAIVLEMHLEFPRGIPAL